MFRIEKSGFVISIAGCVQGPDLVQTTMIIIMMIILLLVLQLLLYYYSATLLLGVIRTKDAMFPPSSSHYTLSE